MNPVNRNIVFIIFAIIGISTQSCIDLRDSDFHPDKEDSRLPKYSKIGYDIAGALVNDDAWRAERMPFSEITLLDISKNDTVIFEMYGQMIEGIFSDDYVSFSVCQTGFNIENFQDLKDLEGRIIQLDGHDNYVVLTHYPKNDEPFNFKNGTGALTFKSIREGKTEYLDAKEKNLFHNRPIQYSGVFEFIFKDSLGNDVKVEKGRFDFVLYPSIIKKQ